MSFTSDIQALGSHWNYNYKSAYGHHVGEYVFFSSKDTKSHVTMSHLRICVNNIPGESVLSRDKYVTVHIADAKNNILYSSHLPPSTVTGSVEFVVINKPTKIYIDTKVPVALYVGKSSSVGYGPKEFLFDFRLEWPTSLH